MKKIAIVGCGNMGGGHAMAIGDGTGYTDWQIPQIIDPEIEEVTTDISKMLKLAGICDIDPKRQEWARNEGYHVYPTLEDVLADPEVDIVLVATPNDIHAEISIKALRAGKHVLCEKPVTPTSAELEEVLRVAKEEGKVFYPRQNRRWDPDFLAIKKIYDEKPIGKPLSLENRIGGGGASAPFGWRAHKKFGGGMMLDWGVHLIDRILLMNTSKVKQIFCQVINIAGTDVDEGFNLTLVFEDGFIAYIESGAGHYDPVTPAWRLNCEHGIAEAEAMTGDGAKTLRPKPRDDSFVREFNALPTRKEPIMRGEGRAWFAPGRNMNIEEPIERVIFDRNSLYRNLVNCIEGKEEQLVKGEQALRVLKIMETALHSAEINSFVEFE
jgi:predicted dehydrogenase